MRGEIAICRRAAGGSCGKTVLQAASFIIELAASSLPFDRVSLAVETEIALVARELGDGLVGAGIVWEREDGEGPDREEEDGVDELHFEMLGY